jgi:hypothetical protein
LSIDHFETVHHFHDESFINLYSFFGQPTVPAAVNEEVFNRRRL